MFYSDIYRYKYAKIKYRAPTLRKLFFSSQKNWILSWYGARSFDTFVSEI